MSLQHVIRTPPLPPRAPRVRTRALHQTDVSMSSAGVLHARGSSFPSPLGETSLAERQKQRETEKEKNGEHVDANSALLMTRRRGRASRAQESGDFTAFGASRTIDFREIRGMRFFRRDSAR